ncbi:MAG: hypothetical protein ABSG28_03360 [Methanoregula sp.]|jgi:hypothetical protein|uniref:hypothetical protein n=1 Tax=Methanoregula sp. TaxID=2052170 RepID=UPI003C160907
MFKKYGLIMLGVVFLAIATGCVSSPGINGSSSVTPNLTVPTPSETIIGYSPDHTNWIRIDPISDLYQGSASNGTITSFNISGTTSYPPGSIFWIDSSINSTRYPGAIYAWSIHEPMIVQKNGSENTFVYSVNVSDFSTTPYSHVGQYQVNVTRGYTNITATAFFNVLRNTTDPGDWIDIDPIPAHKAGDSFMITGTTNLPVGSVMSVSVQFSPHVCPNPISDPVRWPENVCGGDCEASFGNDTVPVVPGTDGDNTWSIVLNTTGWCALEKYDVWEEYSTWKNVSSDTEEFRFH